MSWSGAIASGWLAAMLGPVIDQLAWSTTRGQNRKWWPRCRQCQRTHPPVWSWWKLSCSWCGGSKSSRVVLISALVGMSIVGISRYLSIEALLLPAFWWFTLVGAVLVITDLDSFLLPNAILYPAALLGLVGLVVGGWWSDGGERIIPALTAALLVGLGFLALGILARGNMGMGDVKLSFLLGLYLGYLGWDSVGRGLFLGVMIAGIPALALWWSGQKSRKDPLPYGPPLLVGTWLALLVG